MILVTGAAGKTGKAIIRALAAAGVDVRVFIWRPEQRETVLALGASEAIIGDLHDAAALLAAATGVSAVYHLCPNVHPDEVAIGSAAIGAAATAAVQRFVYHSVLHPQTAAMPHHWNKLLVEAALLESGLDFTVLQPAPYMQNMLSGWESITQRGVYTVPYPVETRLSLVDLRDVAAAAVAVLTEAGHSGATYEVAGTTGLSQVEVAEALSRGLGRPVRAEAESQADWGQRATAAGLGEYAIETLQAMFAYYASYGLCGSPKVLTWLLGRTPSSLDAFIERTVAERGAAPA